MEFKNWLATEETHQTEFEHFVKFVSTTDLTKLEEFQIPQFLKDKISFIQGLAQQARTNWQNLVGLFTNANIFKFFQSINWSMSGLFQLLKSGYDHYRQLVGVIHTISKKFANTQIGQMGEQGLRKIDQLLQQHPIMTKLAGPALAALLAFMWMHQSHTGDVQHDFDVAHIIKAFTGQFQLADLFAGPHGIQNLMLFATHAALHVTFPWPGPHEILLAVALVNALVKEAGGYKAVGGAIGRVANKYMNPQPQGPGQSPEGQGIEPPRPQRPQMATDAFGY